MRRGSLNKYSVVVIFIAALFTVFAYFFDQLVIRSEDKIRNLKINLQNVKNTKNNYEFIASTLTNIIENAQMNFAPLILRRNLTIKSLILSTTKDKRIFKNVDDIEWELIRNFNASLISFNVGNFTELFISIFLYLLDFGINILWLVFLKTGKGGGGGIGLGLGFICVSINEYSFKNNGIFILA